MTPNGLPAPARPTRARGSGEQLPDRQFDRVAAAASAVVGGDEVVADREREREHRTSLDLVLVGAERPEQLAQVLHAPVVDTTQSLGDRAVVARPIADRQLDRK